MRQRSTNSLLERISKSTQDDLGLCLYSTSSNPPPRQGYLDELLVEPGLVDRELVADLQRLVQDSKTKQLGSNGITLFDIDQPFVLDLHFITVSARLITRQTVQFLREVCSWPMIRRTCHRPAVPPPFCGRVRARFELANSPEDNKKSSLQLRILDIIKPIQHRFAQDLMAEPRPGELLLMKRRGKDAKFTPWSYSPWITANNHKALVEFLKSRAADKAKFGV
ncbi:hypothetical protein M413DRAFT_21778 [Hebeloma cylindrosporum]|uniref:Uncharacterized protein n=1 Tax=Hebeloma cylindrosporum TaxID=76867 RepID=A0A0C3CLL6_HEBCY|nr:hypothetical protein M413DRAFT_21778 [Hebeloma cylindrosporum h7]